MIIFFYSVKQPQAMVFCLSWKYRHFVSSMGNVVWFHSHDFFQQVILNIYLYYINITHLWRWMPNQKSNKLTQPAVISHEYVPQSQTRWPLATINWILSLACYAKFVQKRLSLPMVKPELPRTMCKGKRKNPLQNYCLGFWDEEIMTSLVLCAM